METLPRETIVDVLENRLREEILTGRHPAGSYLPPERELADGYGVTRTTLKHAFGRLVQSGLLETRHGVGTRVRDFARLGGADLLPMLVRHSPDWLGEIFEVRRSVGALIAERAAHEGHRRAARRTARRCWRRSRTAEGGDDVQLADIEVHRALARATGNRVYTLLTNTLFNAYLPMRAAPRRPVPGPGAAHDRLEPGRRGCRQGRREGRARARRTRISPPPSGSCSRVSGSPDGRPGHARSRETMLGTVRLDGEERAAPDPPGPRGADGRGAASAPYDGRAADRPGAHRRLGRRPVRRRASWRSRPLARRRIRYRLDFTAQGRRYSLDGWKSISPARPVKSMTVLPFTLTRTASRSANGTLRFPLATRLLPFLASFRFPARRGRRAAPARRAGTASRAVPRSGTPRSTDPATGTGLWLHHELVAPSRRIRRRTRTAGSRVFPADGEGRVRHARFGPSRGSRAARAAGFTADGIEAGPGRLSGQAGDVRAGS